MRTCRARTGWRFAATLAALWLAGPAAAGEAGVHEHEVGSTADSGAGSLRAAIEAAALTPGPDRIHFGNAGGPFASPRTIVLASPLPPIAGEVTIDGHIRGLLWVAYGATVSGAGRHRVFEVAEGGSLRLRGITLADGAARRGGAVLNRGRLVLDGVTFTGNRARAAGGAVANSGELVVVNSTFIGNRAPRGGAIAHLAGRLHVVHGTFHGNLGGRGAALHNAADAVVANSILSGEAAPQCLNAGRWLPASTHNLMTSQRGCGEPILQADPVLEGPAYYNGPTPTLSLGGGSPAVNLGDNASSVDEAGQPLVWDQRGNGDPRFVAGYADLGAFELQDFPDLVVDTAIDTGLRGCTPAGWADCPLRAAIELAAATTRPAHVRFSPAIFTAPATLHLARLPEGAAREIVLDADGAAPVRIVVPDAAGLPWRAVNGATLETGPARAGANEGDPDQQTGSESGP